MRALLRRVMLAFRQPTPTARVRTPDPELVGAERHLTSIEGRLAKKLHVSVEQLRADYERSDGALRRR